MIPSLGRRCLLAAAALAPVLAGASQTRVVRVAAASDLQFVLPEVVQRYAQHAGVQVAVAYAASGQLAMQIVHGAPFDVFL
ncbi:MAG: substrate-binding domain-containing protein, partial [Burkholderiaceae bacterium]